MRESVFRPHGDFRLRVEGRVVVTDVVGPWNVEMLRIWGRHFGEIARPLSAAGPIGSVAVYTGSLISPPETLVLLKKMLAQGLGTLRIAATAEVVTQDVEGYSFARTLFRPVYDDLVPNQVFERLDEALAWLQARLDDGAPGAAP